MALAPEVRRSDAMTCSQSTGNPPRHLGACRPRAPSRRSLATRRRLLGPRRRGRHVRVAIELRTAERDDLLGRCATAQQRAGNKVGSVVLVVPIASVPPDGIVGLSAIWLASCSPGVDTAVWPLCHPAGNEIAIGPDDAVDASGGPLEPDLLEDGAIKNPIAAAASTPTTASAAARALTGTRRGVVTAGPGAAWGALSAPVLAPARVRAVPRFRGLGLGFRLGLRLGSGLGPGSGSGSGSASALARLRLGLWLRLGLGCWLGLNHRLGLGLRCRREPGRSTGRDVGRSGDGRGVLSERRLRRGRAQLGWPARRGGLGW